MTDTSSSTPICYTNRDMKIITIDSKYAVFTKNIYYLGYCKFVIGFKSETKTESRS